MDEIWKSIVGYEDLYEVSSLGRVRSIDRVIIKIRNGRQFKARLRSAIKRPSSNGSGYVNIILSRNSTIKTEYVHRLVATAFLPRKAGQEEVNHIDFDKANNAASNLQWVSHLENQRHYLMKLTGEIGAQDG